MVELIAKSPCDGMLPLEIGDMRVSEENPGRLTLIAPFRGQDKEASNALKDAHGVSWPQPNRSTGKAGNRAIWFGRGQVLLAGPTPDASLRRFAALTDQSDAWAVTRLEGTAACDVLARLVPLDLRSDAFKRGHTARTELAHMMVSLTRTGPVAFQIMTFRSMAKSLVHELKTAMEGVAARR